MKPTGFQLCPHLLSAGVDTGAYLMAQAGLLDGYRCTILWEDQEAMVERFPHSIVTQHFSEVDRDRFTAAVA